MNVLGIDTATPVCSVGLAGDNGLIAEHRLARKHSHAEMLSDMVDWVCTSANISLKTLDGIAVSNGPGSFTGLRIGLGFAKGLAFGADVDLIAVSSLEAMVWSIPPVCTSACVLLTARKGEAYRGLFHWRKNRWVAIQAADTVNEDCIFQGFGDDQILFVGSGTRQFQRKLECDHRAVLLKTEFYASSGFSVAALGREKMNAGEHTSLDEVVPQYIKRFQGVE
ncbi:tRNA (adenosine(37)-N6)-threonylcarbamoyltransferase complex dimerization subunit type 1 TsaB [bacterium]|nr:tRNA (adenosine(37)-N6)-threonylcarbamoyltransferase complex dimerization subunit type 1 TsaB [bacterium]